MSLGLHEKCQAQLREKIAACLPEIRAIHRMFIEPSSVSRLRKVEGSLPQGEIRRKLERYISEAPIFDFVSGRLSRELDQGQKYDSSSADGFPLTELEGYADPNAVAARLVEEFESLPWDYMVTLRLRNDFGELLAREVKHFDFSDSVRAAEASEGFQKEFPIYRDREKEAALGYVASMLVDPTERVVEWDPSCAYLQTQTSGFVGHYGVTAALQQAIDGVKTFCGLGIALGLLRRKYSHSPRTLRACFVIHRRIRGNWAIERTYDWVREASAVLDDLFLEDYCGRISGQQQVLRLRDGLDRIGSVFAEKDRAERIALAGQWLFDSHCGDNELLSFVQTTVAMEILLGDKATSEAIGVGKLLSNRCAYLIGKSQRDRESVLEEFNLIYDVRSQIVHRGKSRFSEKERQLFCAFRHMCHRVIQEEISLLRTDIARERTIEVMWPTEGR